MERCAASPWPPVTSPSAQPAEAYLGTLGGAEQVSTRRTYVRILRRVVAKFGAETAPDEVDAERFAEWFGS